MITQEQIDNIKTDIDMAANAAKALVGVLDPPLIPMVIIGQAVAKQIPELVAVVEKWIAGTPPTDEEKADMAAKLAVLGDPNLP